MPYAATYTVVIIINNGTNNSKEYIVIASVGVGVGDYWKKISQ